jgi:dipeptidyl aminopeptidase/acylaminoacyl peptidase
VEDPVSWRDVLELPLVSSPEAGGEGVAYVVSKPDSKGERLESSLWLWSPRRGSRPLTSGPQDSCPSWGPGGLLAFTRKVEGEVGLAVIAPGGGEARVVARSRFGYRALRWGGGRVYALSRAPLESGEWREYLDRDVLEIERIPIWINGEGFVFDRFSGVVAIDPYSGEQRWIVHGGFDVVAFDVDPGGRYLAYARTYDELRPYLHEVRVVDLESGEEWSLLSGLTVAELAVDPAGRLLAVKARDHARRGFAGHFHVYTIPLRGGEAECLTCSLGLNTLNTANSDVRGPSCSRSLQWGPGDGLYTLVSDAGRVHLYKLLPRGPEPLIAPECGVVDEYTLGPGGEVYYTLMTPTRPKELYRHEGGGGERLTFHTDSWLSRRRLEEPRRHRLRASDGATIDYWVLPPTGGPREGSPWILYIHGGPKTMYGCGFMLEFHALSGAGYAVVYGNPRGSDGYSEEFADIRGHYGERDYQDLMEIADHAPRAEPWLDPGNAGVAGGSYGGFMTAWVITHTDRFRVAVPQRLCSNWISKYGTTDIGWYFNKDQIALGKRPWEDLEAYWSRSPLRYVANARTPTLIVHSLEDYRCFLDQALQLYTALKEIGVPVKLALFPRENHDLSRTGTPRRKAARIRVIIEWLDRWLKRGAGEASST